MSIQTILIMVLFQEFNQFCFIYSKFAWVWVVFFTLYIEKLWNINLKCLSKNHYFIQSITNIFNFKFHTTKDFIAKTNLNLFNSSGNLLKKLTTILKTLLFTFLTSIILNLKCWNKLKINCHPNSVS